MSIPNISIEWSPPSGANRPSLLALHRKHYFGRPKVCFFPLILISSGSIPNKFVLSYRWGLLMVHRRCFFDFLSSVLKPFVSLIRLFSLLRGRSVPLYSLGACSRGFLLSVVIRTAHSLHAELNRALQNVCSLLRLISMISSVALMRHTSERVYEGVCWEV